MLKRTIVFLLALIGGVTLVAIACDKIDPNLKNR